MDPVLIGILVRNVVIPEVLTAIKAWRAARNGEMPTDEQIIATLNLESQRFIAIGKAFLERTAPPPPAPPA